MSDDDDREGNFAYKTGANQASSLDEARENFARALVDLIDWMDSPAHMKLGFNSDPEADGPLWVGELEVRVFSKEDLETVN